VTFRGNELPQVKLFADIGAHFDNLSGKFMTHHYRWTDPALRPLIPLRDVYVGSAHTCMVNTYEYVVGAALWFWNIGHRQPRFGTRFDYGSH
jgi:hypothetical protein